MRQVKLTTSFSKDWKWLSYICDKRG